MVADQAGPREGVGESGGGADLRWFGSYATISVDPRFGIRIGSAHTVRSDETEPRYRVLLSSRVEESRLPRNRMGGQGKRVRSSQSPPLRDRTSFGAALLSICAGELGPRGVRGTT